MYVDISIQFHYWHRVLVVLKIECLLYIDIFDDIKDMTKDRIQ